MHGIVVKIETVCYVHFKCCGYTLYAFYAWRNWTDSFFSLKHLVFFYARSIRSHRLFLEFVPEVDIKSVASSTFSQGFQDEICLIQTPGPSCPIWDGYVVRAYNCVFMASSGIIEPVSK